MRKHEALKRVERAWQDGCLAFHAMEGFSDTAMRLPRNPLDELLPLKAEDLPRRLEAHARGTEKLPLQSLSFLPEGVRMRPYGHQSHELLPSPLYFYDLSQDSPETAARIVVASERNMGSGTISTEKSIEPNSRLPALHQLNLTEEHRYDERPVRPFYLAAEEQEGLVRGQAMMDALTDYYEALSDDPRADYYDHQRKIFRHNELIVAVSHEHMAGLVVPLFNPIHQPMLVEAMGAILGASMFFEHRARGKELPLFSYDIHQGPEDMISLLAANEQGIRALIHRAEDQIAYLVDIGKVGQRTYPEFKLNLLAKKLEPFGITLNMPRSEDVKLEVDAPNDPETKRGIMGPHHTFGKWAGHVHTASFKESSWVVR